MVYSEQLNMFSGVCKRTISITVFEELQQAGVFVYDTNKKQIYDVHIFYGEVFNKQKLPAYLNKIVTNVINLFMWREAGQDDDKHWKISVIVMYVDADIFQRVGHTDIIWCSMLGADSWVYCIIS